MQLHKAHVRSQRRGRRKRPTGASAGYFSSPPASAASLSVPAPQPSGIRTGAQYGKSGPREVSSGCARLGREGWPGTSSETSARPIKAPVSLRDSAEYGRQFRALASDSSHKFFHQVFFRFPRSALCSSAVAVHYGLTAACRSSRKVIVTQCGKGDSSKK